MGAQKASSDGIYMRGCSLSQSGRSKLYFKGQEWGGKCEMLVELVEGFLYSMDIPWGSPKLFLYPGNYEFGLPHHFFKVPIVIFFVHSLMRMTGAHLNSEECLICLPSSGSTPAKCMKSRSTSEIIQPQMWERLSPYRAYNSQCPLKIFPRGGKAGGSTG